MGNENKTNEGSNKTGGSAKAKSGELPSINDKSKNNSFLLLSTQNDSNEVISGEVIANYFYPNLNDNEYEFVLVKKGEDIFLSDQGKTLTQLNKIFELSEPDVIKNLVAILKQYDVTKQENEFVIKINNWNGNTNKDENEDLNKGLLSLFSCVSFMLNMKIFYI